MAIQGYRYWRVRENGSLQSYVVATPWTPGKPVPAKCCISPYGSMRVPGPVPHHQSHPCGYHAFKTLDLLRAYSVSGKTEVAIHKRWAPSEKHELVVVVMGVADLWGVVWEHEFGFRSEFAAPAAFIRWRDPRAADSVLAAAGVFGVPVIPEEEA